MNCTCRTEERHPASADIGRRVCTDDSAVLVDRVRLDQ
jgi:hypothetical protein